jgi:hypothetical protein
LLPFVSRIHSKNIGSLPFTGVIQPHQYCEPLRPPSQPGFSLASCQLIHIAVTAGTSRVASGPLCLHVVATTRQVQWKLVRSYDSIRFSLPLIGSKSAPVSSFSRPVERSLTFRPACSPSRLRDLLRRRLQQLRCCSGCHRSPENLRKERSPSRRRKRRSWRYPKSYLHQAALERNFLASAVDQ